MRLRRNKFQIEQDALLRDRIANLEKLVKDPETSPADREKFHRQLSATRARQTRLKREREDKRRQRQIEAAQAKSAKLAERHADAPADHDHPERTQEEIAALPQSLRELFYGIKPEPAPVEIEPQALPEPEPEPQPVPPRRSSFDPILPAPEDAERALQWNHRLMASWNGTAVFYQLPSGQIVDPEGFPFLGRMAIVAGRRMLSDGTPAVLYSSAVVEDTIPGAVFWHGAYFAPEDKQHVLEALNKSWRLPALVPDDIDPLPAIAVTHEEAAINQELRAEEIRYAMRPEAAYGY